MNTMIKNLFICLLCLTTTWTAQAATINAIKGDKAIITLSGEQVNVGDTMYATDANGKRTGLIKVLQVKNNKAMVQISKGRAVKGGGIAPRAAASAPAKTAQQTTPTKNSKTGDFSQAFESSKGNRSFGIHRTLKDSYGLLGGFQMNSMTVDNTELNGSGMNLGGFYSFAFANALSVEGHGTYEQFNTQDSSGAKTVNIGYLGLYGLAKWYPIQTTFRLWVGGGVAYLIAMQKEAKNSLNPSSISSNQVFTANFGLDYQLNRNHYIPVSFSYVIFPDSDKGVTGINSMQFKIGWGWNL